MSVSVSRLMPYVEFSSSHSFKEILETFRATLIPEILSKSIVGEDLFTNIFSNSHELCSTSIRELAKVVPPVSVVISG